MVAAVEVASAAHIQEHGAVPEHMPALLEVAHEIRLGSESQCCPCAEGEEEQSSF